MCTLSSSGIRIPYSLRTRRILDKCSEIMSRYPHQRNYLLSNYNSKERIVKEFLHSCIKFIYINCECLLSLMSNILFKLIFAFAFDICFINNFLPQSSS